jgi:hypothetical protein
VNSSSEYRQKPARLACCGRDFYEQELRAAGYKARAQIIDYPGGVPGDVGIFLSW